MLSNKFILHSNYTPAGDQLEAIARLISGVEEGATHQTLQGITGSGKTFTMANIIHRLKRPTLILAPNKTLTAQLYDEMKRFFPENAVEYFVSYYDYFQPEVYIPGNDRFIKKDSAINEQLERLRLSTTKALIERRDVIVVASVSSIYGLGHPDQYRALQIPLSLGQEIGHDEFIRRLLLLQYERSEKTLKRAMFRVTGNVFDIFPADSEYLAVRVSITDDIIQTLQWVDPVTGKVIGDITHYLVSPKTLFATPKNSVDLAAKEILAEMEEQIKVFNKENRFVEAERLHGRVTHDVEMMKQVGYCSGIENYSSYLSDRDPNLPPTTLMDYLPKDGLLFIDESHVMLPQISAMYRSDQSRKDTLIDYGFRLPSSRNNRPLNLKEFESIKPQTIFVSATPGKYELQVSHDKVVQQIIRPTGLLDPEVEVRGKENYLEDLLYEISQRVEKNERVLVTTLTKASAEELHEYFVEHGLKSQFMHSDVKVDERVEIIKQLRLGVFDVLVGISLLREGLDIPEASLVAIINADRAGFLRSTSALIQMIGRASRNQHGKAILYADEVTSAKEEAINQTKRRRHLQISFNEKNEIIPSSSTRKISNGKTEESNSFAHSDAFCKSLAELCQRITEKEQQLLDLTNDGNEKGADEIRNQLVNLYKQFIYI